MDLSQLTPDQRSDLLISLGIVLFTAIVGGLVIRPLLRRLLIGIFRRTRMTLDDVLLRTLRPPVHLAVVTLACELAVRRLDFLPAAWQPSIDRVFFILYFIILFLTAWRLTVNLFRWYDADIAPHTHTNLDEQLIPFFSRVAQTVIAVIGLIILLSHFDVDVSGLVTTLGVGSLAIALAAQATLADTISGFIIMIDRPFRIGDRIELQELNTWGDVVDIGLRSSRILTRDNRMVIIPNSVVSKGLIVNHSYPNESYRLQVDVGVRYGSDIHEVRRLLAETVQKIDGVSADRPVDVLFIDFGATALVFRVRWWIASYRDTRVVFDRVNTAIHDALGPILLRTNKTAEPRYPDDQPQPPQ